jgi:hypothetical protein
MSSRTSLTRYFPGVIPSAAGEARDPGEQVRGDGENDLRHRVIVSYRVG